MKISLLVEGSTTELAQALNALHNLENGLPLESAGAPPILSIAAGHRAVIGQMEVTGPEGSEVQTLNSAAPAADKKTRAKKEEKNEKPVVEAAKPVTEPEPSDQAITMGQDQAEAASEGPSLQEIRAVFGPKATTHQAKVVALLAEFGAEKLTKFYESSAPEQHAEFFEKLKAL